MLHNSAAGTTTLKWGERGMDNGLNSHNILSLIVALPIMQILNLSISLSTVPDKSKISKLKPLFKKGSRTDPKNYRPISLLPLISKIFERAIHDQLQYFLEENKILYKYQSGFRKSY